MSASDIAGKRIREARIAKGWRVRDVAGHCAKAGAGNITATVITNLETRRRATREITVDEWLTLAYVLDVPPIQLVSPLSADEQLEIVPGVTKGILEAGPWIADDAAAAVTVRSMQSEVRNDTAMLLRIQGADALTAARVLNALIPRIRAVSKKLADREWVEQHPRDPACNEGVIATLGTRFYLLLDRLALLEHQPPVLPEIEEILRRHGVSATTADWNAGEEGDSRGQG
jgi:transcriptional regulator with XRE-family HTH domain